MAKTDAELRKFADEWGGLAMALSAVAAFGLLCYQGYNWLRYGVWPPYSGNTLIEYCGGSVSRIRWIGLQKIIEWLAWLPMWIWIIGIGVAIHLLLGTIINDAIQNGKKPTSGQ